MSTRPPSPEGKPRWKKSRRSVTCPDCGNPLQPGAPLCTSCGHQAGDAPIRTSAHAAPRIEAPPAPLPVQPRGLVGWKGVCTGLAAVVIAGWLMVQGCSSSPSQDSQDNSASPPAAPSAAPAPQPQAVAETPNYTLKSSEDCTVDADKPCRRIRIVVPKGQSKTLIAADLTDAAKQAASQYNSVRGIAFAYAAGTDTGGEYSAGRALWGPDENTDGEHSADAPQIDYVDDYFQPEKPARSSVTSIPEKERRRIVYEIGQAEDQADHEAEAAYPIDGSKANNAAEMDRMKNNVMPHADMSNRLEEKYHTRVQRRHHLTDQQFSDIMVEGAEKHWPTPDPSKD